MGKLIATTQATVDGVVDPVDEWVQPDGDHGDYSFERQARSSGLVLGRKTYEGLAGYWPSASGKWADMVNPMPKYVGSNTLSGDLEWNATLLEGDLEDSIPKLKDEVDGDRGWGREAAPARATEVRSRLELEAKVVVVDLTTELSLSPTGSRATVRSPSRRIVRRASDEGLLSTGQVPRPARSRSRYLRPAHAAAAS